MRRCEREKDIDHLQEQSHGLLVSAFSGRDSLPVVRATHTQIPSRTGIDSEHCSSRRPAEDGAVDRRPLVPPSLSVHRETEPVRTAGSEIHQSREMCSQNVPGVFRLVGRGAQLSQFLSDATHTPRASRPQRTQRSRRLLTEIHRR